MSMITIIVVMIMVVNMYQLEQFQSWIYRRPSAATTPVSVVVFAVVTKAEALVVKATAVSVSVQCLDLLQTFTAATVLASLQCMLALPESTLCYTSDATALASIDPASADHNPARFRDSSISSAISRQLQSVRPSSNDAQFIYTICSHGKASVLVRDSSISSETSMQRKSVVTMLILFKLFTLQNIRQH